MCSQMFRDANFVKIHDSLGVPLSKFVTTFRFWQRADGAALCREITEEGLCPSEHTVHIGPTGHHVVVSLVNSQMGHLYKLVLIQFNPNSNSCSSHELELPTGVGVGGGRPLAVLSVDDHRGVVWLIEDCDLISIPYV